MTLISRLKRLALKQRKLHPPPRRPGNTVRKPPPHRDTMSPADFAEYVSRGSWRRAAHLKLLSDKLAELEARGIRRLIVTMPPRHGKTQLCSRAMPAWYLLKHPTHRVILASYGERFARGHGRQAREYLEEFGHHWDVSVKSTTRAANEWELASGGGMITVGIGGPITGRGADVLIIDDPVKNEKEAASPVVQQNHWEWFQATARTRLEPDGVIILIQTRWHENDLAGRILAEEGHEWEMLNLPALAEEDDPLGRIPGQALWPERFDENALDDIRLGAVDPKTGQRRGGMSEYWWAALYQQHPGPRDGSLFKRAWFRIVDAVPQLGYRVRFWDLAASDVVKGGDPDWTAGVKMFIDQDKQVFIEDVVRFRASPLEVRKVLRQTAELDGIDVEIYAEQEPGSSGKSYIDNLRREVFQGFSFQPLIARQRGSKITLAGPLSAQAEAGNVCLLRAAWNQEFLREAEGFPHGSHDDQIDAAASGYYVLTGSAFKTRHDVRRVSNGVLKWLEGKTPDCPVCRQPIYYPAGVSSLPCAYCGQVYQRV
jgi:predicted phage terminase large subunit-like protein